MKKQYNRQERVIVDSLRIKNMLYPSKSYMEYYPDSEEVKEGNMYDVIDFENSKIYQNVAITNVKEYLNKLIEGKVWLVAPNKYTLQDLASAFLFVDKRLSPGNKIKINNTETLIEDKRVVISNTNKGFYVSLVITHNVNGDIKSIIVDDTTLIEDVEQLQEENEFLLNDGQLYILAEHEVKELFMERLSKAVEELNKELQEFGYSSVAGILGENMTIILSDNKKQVDREGYTGNKRVLVLKTQPVNQYELVV